MARINDVNDFDHGNNYFINEGGLQIQDVLFRCGSDF